MSKPNSENNSSNDNQTLWQIFRQGIVTALALHLTAWLAAISIRRVAHWLSHIIVVTAIEVLRHNV